MYKVIFFAAVISVARAGLLGAPLAAVSYAAPHAIASPAVVSQHSNILRTPGNLGQVSTYSKSIHTPHSSVTKSDIRVSNDALAYHAAPVAVAHAAPIATFAHAAPIATVAHAAPIAAVAHAAPIAAVAHAAPIATVAHAAPLATVAHAAPVALGHTLSYSAAPVVSHIAFEGIGAHYEY